MRLFSLQLKDSDLLISSNRLLVGLRLLVDVTMPLYISVSIELICKMYRVRVQI